MQIALKSVHLVNFRKHADYTFTPAPQGITAILGENGHGKSSIIDAIAWALYGTKPSKMLKTTALRRIDAPDDAECYVEVALLANNADEIMVKRMIKGSIAQCECYQNGVLVAGPAVTSANKWILTTFSIDEDAFLSAILVQQKQVDSIISQSPSVRQAMVEKLTGIAAASLAMKQAREAALGSKKVMQTLAPETVETKEIKHCIEETQTKLAEVTEKRKNLEGVYKNQVALCQKLAKDLENAQNGRILVQKLDGELETLKQSVSMLKEQQSQLMEQVTSLKKDLPESTDLKALEAQLSKAEQAANTLTMQQAELEAIIKNKPSKKVVEQAKNGLEAKNAQLEAFKSEKELKNSLKTARIELANSTALIKQAQKALKTLKGDSLTCPTCLQTIDNPAHIIDENKRIIEEQEKNQTVYQQKIDEIEQNIADRATVKDELKEAENTVKSVTERISAANKAVADKAEMQPSLKGALQEVKELQSTMATAKVNASQIEQYHKNAQNLTKVNEKLTLESKNLKLKQSERENTPTVTESNLNKIKKEAENAQNKLQELTIQATTYKGDVTLLKERLKNAQNSLKLAEKQAIQRQNAIEQFTIDQASTTVLAHFRAFLSQEVLPMLTDEASTLLSAITDGLFIAVTMDSKYNITVTNKRQEQFDVSALSGGEQSAVAIAMRLAISKFLANGNTMLILDEVLTAMDNTRVQAILDVIQHAGHQQVIIIAHNEVVKTIADTVVEL